jgi:hypothetical protein
MKGRRKQKQTYDSVCEYIQRDFCELSPPQMQQVVDELDDYEDRLGAARYYYTLRGWKTLLLPNAAKRPLKKSGAYENLITNAKKVYKEHAPANEQGRKQGAMRGKDYNLAVACGPDSASLIDIDVKGGRNGFITLNELEAKHGPLSGWFKASTPSGGGHFWKEGDPQFRATVGSSLSGLGDGIDTRGATKGGKSNSHGVVYPSVTTEGTYCWLESSAPELTDIEDWVLDKLARKSRLTEAIGRGNEYVESGDLDSFDLQDFLSALDAINPDDCEYDQWLGVGFACADAESRAPKRYANSGLEWWDKWSAKGERYEADECWKRWDGIDAGGGVTVATVFWLAREHGWKSDLKEKVLSLNEQYAFITDNNQVADLQMAPDYAVMQLSEFRNLMRNQGAKIADKWIESEGRQTVRALGYLPGGSRIYEDSFSGVQLYNRFSLPEIPYTEAIGEINIFLDHTRLLFARPEDMELFLDWLAVTVFRPRERIQFTPLLIAEKHGVGRGWVAKLLERLLGPDNCKQTEMDILAGQSNAGQYHDYLHESLIVTVHETKLDGKAHYTVDHHIRDKLTNDRFQLNLKYGRNAMYWIYCNFLLFSNHTMAMTIPQDDRRIWVVKSGHTPTAADAPYYERLYNALGNPEFISQVFSFLQRRNWKTFNVGMRAPMTPEKQVMIDGGQGTVEQAMSDFIGDPTTGDCFVPADLLSAVRERYSQLNGCSEDGWSDSAFNRIKQAKFVRWQGPDRSTRKKLKYPARGLMQVVWIVRNPENWLYAEADAIRQELDLVTGLLHGLPSDVTDISEAFRRRERDED